MKTFHQFITEVYDKDVMGRSQITKQGEGGRVGAKRKKTEPEKKRVKAIGGGKTAPAKTYKDRKDIGTQKPRSQREQQPTKERGSAGLSPREQQRKAAQERRASKSGSQSKKDLEKTASKMLSKKTTKTVDPKYKGHKQSGYSRAERQKIIRKGERELIKTRLQNLGKEKESDLKNPISTTQKSKDRKKK